MCLQPGVTGGGKVCLVGGMDLSHAGNLWNWNCLITGGFSKPNGTAREFFIVVWISWCAIPFLLCSWKLTSSFSRILFLSFSIAVTIVAHNISSRYAAFVSAWKYPFINSNVGLGDMV